MRKCDFPSVLTPFHNTWCRLNIGKSSFRRLRLLRGMGTVVDAGVNEEVYHEGHSCDVGRYGGGG